MTGCLTTMLLLYFPGEPLQNFIEVKKDAYMVCYLATQVQSVGSKTACLHLGQKNTRYSILKRYQISISILSVVSTPSPKGIATFPLGQHSRGVFNILENKMIRYAVNQLAICFVAFLMNSACFLSLEILDLYIQVFLL